jgi:hypothetical protein
VSRRLDSQLLDSQLLDSQLLARRLRLGVRCSGIVAPVAVLGLAVAGCGGSQAPAVANLGQTTATGAPSAGNADAPSTKPSRAEFASCLTQHGFSAAVGSAATASGSALSVFGVTVSGNVNPSSPQFQAALRACEKDIPGGGPPSLTPAQQAVAAKAMLSFAGCMRRNGEPGFPDPDGDGRFPLGAISGLDPNSPPLQRAFNACQSLEPKVGPRISFTQGNVAERG